MMYQLLRTFNFQLSRKDSNTLPSSSSASPTTAIIRPGTPGVTDVPGHGLGGKPLRRKNCSVSAQNVVAAAPRPTDPVLKSTSGRSFVREGYGWTPPSARKRFIFSLFCRPIKYCNAWKIGPACGFTATRSWGWSTRKYSAVRMVTKEALDAWWPPTFRPSRLGRTLFALWIMSVANQFTRVSNSRRSSNSDSMAPPVGLGSQRSP
mmetsp:Transcript_55633/g.169251  ORF Transcript_55633/g.169251 Transcript_55633/m.169251 type:complete len:206 (-) Transcript_55633:6-623(-)